MHAPSPKLSYTVDEATAATGFARRRIYSLINDGSLTTFKSGRRRMISARALDDLITRLEREATPKDAA